MVTIRGFLTAIGCLMVLLSVSITPAAAERRVALVIGNSGYRNLPPLDNPKNDATLMAQTLKGLGFTLVGNGPHIDLDKLGLESVLQTFSNQIQGADVGLFYYAGHGIQVRGSNYLVPVSANPAREADVDFQLVDTALVLRQMEGAGTRLNLVILDACRNNPLAGRGLRSADSGLAQMRAPEGTLISFATQPGNVAQDGTDGNSPYTKALARTIRRPGLDIFRTFNEIGLAVASATGGAQQPWVSLSPIRGEFYFAGAPTGAVTTPSPPAPQPDPAGQAWLSAKDTTSVAVLEEFVRRFGDSFYASLARARIEELRRSEALRRPQVAAAPPTQQPAQQPPASMAQALLRRKPGNIMGAGATFPYPIYAKWGGAYQKETGATLNYQSIGSAGGIKQIKARTVQFGSSDVNLPGSDAAASKLVQFPTVLGAVVPIFNLQGVPELILDGPTLASIFLGDIKTWSDPAIRRLNPGARLPDQSITVVHRSEGTGTTFIFADYLVKVSDRWRARVGANTTLEWPVGTAAKGNEGMATTVAQAAGSIGYVEHAYARQQGLKAVKLVNKDGVAVAASPVTIQAAAAAPEWAGSSFEQRPSNMSGANSWPITTATYVLVEREPSDLNSSLDVLQFFAWAFANGDRMASELDYVPLPANVKAAIQRTWADQIRTADGAAVLR